MRNLTRGQNEGAGCCSGEQASQAGTRNGMPRHQVDPPGKNGKRFRQCSDRGHAAERSLANLEEQITVGSDIGRGCENAGVAIRLDC